MVASTSSVAGRAALAVGLMIGFYLLAVGIAGGLLFLPYAEYAFAHRVHPKLALVCVLGAGTILWSIVPRRDRFDAPGPRLTRERHPKLFSEIESVAAPPGASVTARRDGDEIRPFETVGTLADGSLDGATWRADAERFGVAGLPLAT